MTQPVPTPSTVAVGDYIAAALWNSNVYGAVEFLINPPQFYGYQATAQAVASSVSTWSGVALDTSVSDTYSGHSTVTNNTRYYAQVAGWYWIHCRVEFSAATGGGRAGIGYLFDTATTPTTAIYAPLSTSQVVVLELTDQVYMNVGDSVAMIVTQNSGASVNLFTNYQGTSMQLKWQHT